MKTLYRISLLCTLLLASFWAIAQSVFNTDDAYGMDPLLFNGKLYRYYVAPGTLGTQFLNGTNPVEGSVQIRGITYDKRLLKYDIYNQQLVLQYFAPNGGVNQIVVSDAWLEAFSLGEADFRVLHSQDSLRRIYQVIGIGPLRIMYYWSKQFALDILVGAVNHRFSLPEKTTFLWMDNEFKEYSGKRSFVSLFEKDKQPELKKFLRRNRISVRKSTDAEILELINFCNTLYLK
jgi:hypothetical protein